MTSDDGYAVGIFWSMLGIHYTSKLDEFVNFIEKIRKYGFITSSFSVESKPSIILLIDDLPVTNGRVAFERLQNCLLLLVRTTRIPTAILVTDYGKADSADHTARCLDELQSSLEHAGACKVTFLNKFSLKIDNLLFLLAYLKLLLFLFRLLLTLLQLTPLRRHLPEYAGRSSLM